jgi:hypothetical protein
MIAANERRNMEMADILITANLSGYASTDYNALPKIVEKGFQGAENKSKMLSRLSVDEASWKSYLQTRESKRIQTVPTTQFVAVEGAIPAVNKAIETYTAGFIDRPDREQHHSRGWNWALRSPRLPIDAIE